MKGLYKTILDSVHGRIKIPEDWCRDIIDTPEFQRLRRIEQNSCRAVFPSARHDRFIHSLGVFHIGNLISDHISKTCKCLPEGWDIISTTYKLACLLHDVGHTPFSHTFEEFYNRKQLINELRGLITSIAFLKDSDIPEKEFTHHELLSAWVGYNVYKEKFKDGTVDWELFVRMIIGLTYNDENGNSIKQEFKNIIIELIHGTIDADGLDYVCRDVWAGGYHNFSVDIHRLIEGIVIIKENEDFILAFHSKALNEIETVLNVKNFQFLYVINHHKVILEQHYLLEGVKHASQYHLGIPDKEDAIRKLCDYHAFLQPVAIGEDKHYKLFRPCDDDFVALMKLCPDTDEYIKDWFSRSHSLIPLWKSKVEFFHLFDDIIKAMFELERFRIAPEPIKSSIIKNSIAEAVNDVNCRDKICEDLQIETDKFFIYKIKTKFRRFDPKKIRVSINNKVVSYDRFSSDGFKVYGHEGIFYFWYVHKSIFDRYKKEEIISHLKNYLKLIFGLR